MRKIVSIILVALLIFGAFSGCGQKVATVEELLSLGERYLTELDYEKALVTFNKVIEIEPMNTQAYIGAAEAYIELGNTERAISTLELGFERTGSQDIKDMLDSLTERDNSLTVVDESNYNDFTFKELSGEKRIFAEYILDALMSKKHELLFEELVTEEYARLFEDLVFDDAPMHLEFDYSYNNKIFHFYYFHEGGSSEILAGNVARINNIIQDGMYYEVSRFPAFEEESPTWQVSGGFHLMAATFRSGKANGAYEEDVINRRTGPVEYLIRGHISGEAVNGLKHGTEYSEYTDYNGVTNSFSVYSNGKIEAFKTEEHNVGTDDYFVAYYVSKDTETGEILDETTDEYYANHIHTVIE